MHVVYLILSRYAQNFRNFLKVSSLEQICGILTNLRDFKVSDFHFPQ